ncbi:MAG: signal peptidase II [Candidatus Acidiferrales bacterium]
MSEARSGARWLWLSAAALAADRATKYLIETRTSDAYRFVVVPRIVTIVHSQNPGIAFGVFSDSPSRWLEVALVTGAVAVLALLIWLLVSGRAGGGLARAGVALMAGGAAGNVLDRLMHGMVTDFVEVRLGHYVWPAFNVADSALSIGAALILIELLFSGRETRRARA